MPGLVLAGRAVTKIRVVRGIRVIMDSDLAEIYGVTTGALNQAIKRNRARFPPDFAFQMAKSDRVNLKSQFVISSSAHGGRRTQPLLFTEHGAIMAASVLNSRRAVEMSIYVVRAFIKLREAAATQIGMLAQLKDLERTVGRHDRELKEVIVAVQQLLAPVARPRRTVGFR